MWHLLSSCLTHKHLRNLWTELKSSKELLYPRLLLIGKLEAGFGRDLELIRNIHVEIIRITAGIISIFMNQGSVMRKM